MSTNSVDTPVQRPSLWSRKSAREYLSYCAEVEASGRRFETTEECRERKRRSASAIGKELAEQLRRDCDEAFIKELEQAR